MVKRKVARRGFEMKWMAVVIAGSALLAQGGLATAKESALPPRECAAKAQAAAMKLRDMTSAIEAERSEEHTSELQSLMRISYAVFCLKKKKIITLNQYNSS